MNPVVVFCFTFPEDHLKMEKVCRWPCKLTARMFHGIPVASSLVLPKPSDDEHCPPFREVYKIRKKLVVKNLEAKFFFKRRVWNW